MTHSLTTPTGATAPAEPPSIPGLHVTFARVVASEWTKFRSLRSTVWTLLVAVVLAIGLAALICSVIDAQWATAGPQDRAQLLVPGGAATVSLVGMNFAQLAFGVLGVLLMSSEYSTGMIRSSLTAVPRRLPVLWAKLVVYAVVVFLVGLVTSFVAFFLGQALLSGTGAQAHLGDPDVLRSVIGAAMYVTVAGCIGLTLGTILRNTAAGISLFVAVFFVIPPLTVLLPSSFRHAVAPYLPSNAGGALWAHSQIDDPLAPWTGFGVLCLYLVVLGAVAAWRLRTTDA